MEMPDIFLAAQQGPAVDCRFIWRRWVCGDSDTTPSINVTHPRKIRTSLRCKNQILPVVDKKAIKIKLLLGVKGRCAERKIMRNMRRKT
jgi:hypothetical protein